MDPVADLVAALPDDPRNALGRFRFKVAAALHGRVSQGRSTPVIVVRREDRPALVVDVDVWRASDARDNLHGLVRELFDAAGGYRDELAPDEAELAQVIVMAPDDGEPDLDDFAMRLAALRMTRFVVCVAAAPARWYRLDGLTLRSVSGLDAAMRHLLHGEFPSPVTEDPEPPAAERPLRVLLVADEWRSSTGGISTVNRELGIALVRAGVDVRLVLPDADPAERAQVEADGVRLVLPEPVPGLGRLARLLTPAFADDCLTEQYVSPQQPRHYGPDVIVGHGRILGPYAYSVQRTFFPQAFRVHIVHTDADRLEEAKETPGGASRMMTAEQRRALELELAVSADLVAGVGPLLADSIRDLMLGAARRPPVINLVPGLRDWGGTVDPGLHPSGRQVLLLARAEDVRSKGIDLAVAGLQRATARLGDGPGGHPRLVIRGVQPADDEAVKQRIDELCKAAPDAEVIRRPYATDPEELRGDMWSSRVVVMPSRHEGFGLAAYEAIAAGVPVRITANSGLARLLADVTTDGERPMPREVVSTRGTDEEVGVRWGDALAEVLVDPRAAFTRASDLREQLLRKVSWENTVAGLLGAIADERAKRPA
ncbi:glycosyltransferase family 4 protein [Dactylosporangium salmoneum]